MSIDTTATGAIPPQGTTAQVDLNQVQGEAFVFRGSVDEYFKIWIVNLLLTVVTLGIYSAWAKVRSRKYLSRSTYLAGDSFDYHAKPLGILIGRLIAAAGLAAVFVTAWVAPGWETLPLLLISLAAPFLITKGAAFNARNTSWRNIRFSFRQDVGGAYAA
ncbi:MAG: DUF898 family protein, partial [Pseudomonadota bacterium]